MCGELSIFKLIEKKKEAVFKLIGKKNKKKTDKRLIKNWRPIPLLRIDAKKV